LKSGCFSVKRLQRYRSLDSILQHFTIFNTA